MKKRNFKNALLTIFGFFLVVSCKNNKPSQEIRYIITSPEVAEIIALIEGTQNIVGVTTECDFPSELKKIPKVGTFGKVDFEKIIELKPTIVFISGLEQKHLAAELNKLDIKTELIYPKSIAEMISSIRKIGTLLDKEKRANFIADSLQTQINQFTSSTNSTNSTNLTNLPKVYIEIYGNPIMSVSDNSFIGEVIQLAGGNNIFAHLPRDYSRIKPEDVILADPEIILLTYPGISAEQIKERKGWYIISACKNNRIYTVEDINPDLILRASPRIIEGMKLLQKAFYE